jgi:hypothetical protein
VITGLFTLGALTVQGGNFPSPRILIAAQNPAAPSAPIVVSAEPPAVDKQPLARKEVVGALAKYVEDTYRELSAMERLFNLYLARLRQDVKRNDLEKFKADAIEMGKVMQAEADTLSLAVYPDNLADTDRERFAAIEVATMVAYDGMVMITIDILAHEHLGTNVRSDLKQDSISIKKAIAHYRKKVMAAYKFYGYSARHINKKTLRIKPGAGVKGPY